MVRTGLVARCLAVWSLVTVGAWWLGGLCLEQLLLIPGTLRSSGTTFEDLLVPAAAVLALGAGLHLWVLTTSTACRLVRGSRPALPDTFVRRLVVLACGGTLALGTLSPAHAEPSEDRPASVGSVLNGLPLPERASLPRSTPEHETRSPQPDDGPGRRHVVRSGESLWSIAQERSGPGSTDADVDRAWRRIHQLNVDVVGTEPDLIHPGQSLRLPGAANHEATHHEGERP